MSPYIIHLEPEDGRALRRDYLLVFAYSPREAMFNAGAQVALLGYARECIGMDREDLEGGYVFYVEADGLLTTCYDIHRVEFWEIFEQEVEVWMRELTRFSLTFPWAARDFKKVGISKGMEKIFESYLPEFNAAIERYEIEQQLNEPPQAKRKQKAI